MIHLICFCFSFFLLIYIFTYDRIINNDLVCLILAIIVGNGGYLALTYSDNLEEAILANKITYVIGVFVPMIVFFLICSVCRINISIILRIVMYLIQVLIYLSVCTIGKLDIYYKTVEFNVNNGMAYLDKTYGPMHAVYLISLYLYTLMAIVVGIWSLMKRTTVSHVNVDMVLSAEVLVICVYMVERLVHLNFDIVPVVYTVSAVVILIPVVKTYKYSVQYNPYICEDVVRENATIVFDNRLRFMGCNDMAYELFPELEDWELEVKIPGNGGRFNTFLRQPLLKYIEKADSYEYIENSYEYKDKDYIYRIFAMRSRYKKCWGYVIRISDMTGIINKH